MPEQVEDAKNQEKMLETPEQESPLTAAQPEEGSSGSQAEPSSPPAPSRPGFLKRGLQFLFNPETRFGRTVRAVTRALALTVSFFALGFLLAYLLLYRPASQSLEEARLEAETLQGQLASAEESLQTTRQDLLQAQERLSIQQTRIQVLSVLDHAQSARLALSARNGAATAQKSIAAAVQQLEQALPEIKALDPNLATTLKARLDLISAEAARDPKTAVADLNILIEALQLLDQNLSQK